MAAKNIFIFGMNGMKTSSIYVNTRTRKLTNKQPNKTKQTTKQTYKQANQK